MPRRCFMAASLALVLSLPVAAPAMAQVFPTDDATIRAIWREGTQNSQVQRLTQVLADSIGPRLTGSPGQDRAHDWAVGQYRAWGIEASNEQYGTWRQWRRGISHIHLVAPRVRSLDGMLLAWSHGTGGRDLEGPAILLPEVADRAAFSAWLPQVQGRWVMINFPEPTCRPDAAWQVFGLPGVFERMDAEREAARNAWNARVARIGLEPGDLQRTLEQAGALGIVTTAWTGNYGARRIFNGRTERIPVFDLSCEDYGLVARLAGNGQAPVLRAYADAEWGGEVPVFNTIARIPGRELPDEYIVLSAHFDTWDGASGATDNGTGTVVMMEAMRILRAVLPNPRRTILVGHWSGEEQGLNGSRAFAFDNPQVVDGLQVLLNQDNGTGQIAVISMMGLAEAGGPFATWLSRIPAELSAPAALELPGMPVAGGSDHAAFLCHGAPAFRLGSAEWDYRDITWHTNLDTYDKVVLENVRNNAMLTAMLAYQASQHPERVSRVQRELPATNPWPSCPQPARSWEESPRVR